MKFDMYTGASEFIAAMRPRLNAGTVTAIGPDGPIKWDALSSPPDRLVIVGPLAGPVDVFIERWPANAIRDDARPTLVPLHRIKALRVSEAP